MNLDFYVYGDFFSIVNAFKMVANVFSNNAYKSWITIFMLFGVVAFAFHMNMERAFGAKLNDSAWIKRIIWGMLIYSMLMVPTMTIHVYDPVKNRYEAVGGVPIGAGLFASITSTVSRELIDIVETAGSPIMSANEIGFGSGFEMLAASAAMGSIGGYENPMLAKSLQSYLTSCVTQAQVNGDIKIKDIWKSDNLLETIKLNYRVFSSVIYTDSNPAGTLMECADAHTNISGRLLNPTLTENVMKNFCSRVGYDIDEATEYNACKSKFSGMLDSFAADTGFSVTLANYVASKMVSEAYLNYGITHNVHKAIEISKQMAASANYASGAVAADYIPKLQGMIMAILISTFIIVALFIYIAPTDAIKWYIGMWLWVIIWFVVDVIMNISVQNHAYEIFRHIRKSGLGLSAMFYTGRDTVEILAMYGNAKWMSMSLASVITFGIVKMGGSAAFAGMTSSLAARYQQGAASLGSQMGTPGGQAGFNNQLYDDAVGVDMGNYRTPFNARAESDRRRIEELAGQHRAQKTLGQYGGDSHKASQDIGDAGYAREMENIGAGAGKIRASEETGVGIAEGAMAKAMKSHSENSAIHDRFSSGWGTDNFRMISGTKLDSERGKAEAAQQMADGLGLDVATMQHRMSYNDGLDNYSRYSNLKSLADSKGVKMSEMIDMKNRSASFSVSDSEAERMGLPGAGSYQLSWDGWGNTSYLDGKSGERIWSGSLNEDVDKHVKDHVDTDMTGSKSWTGTSVISEDTDKSVEDHRDVSKSGAEIDNSRSVKNDSSYAGTYRSAFTMQGAENMARLAWNNAKARSKDEGIGFNQALRQELSAQTEDWVGSVNKFFKRDGVNIGEFKHSTGSKQGFGLPEIFGISFGVSASQGVSTGSQEKDTTNLLMSTATQSYQNILKQAESSDGQINYDEFSSNYAKSIHESTSNINEYLQKTDKDFGKDSIVPTIPESKYGDNSENPLIRGHIKDIEDNNY